MEVVIEDDVDPLRGIGPWLVLATISCTDEADGASGFDSSCGDGAVEENRSMFVGASTSLARLRSYWSRISSHLEASNCNLNHFLTIALSTRRSSSLLSADLASVLSLIPMADI